MSSASVLPANTQVPRCARDDKVDLGAGCASASRWLWRDRPHGCLSRPGLGLRRGSNSFYILHVCAQDFRHAPRLRDAAAWSVGGVAVENLGNVTQASVGEMILQRGEPFACLMACWFAAAIDLHISGDKRSQQPWPDRALVIGAVAAGGIASVASAILWIGAFALFVLIYGPMLLLPERAD